MIYLDSPLPLLSRSETRTRFYNLLIAKVLTLILKGDSDFMILKINSHLKLISPNHRIVLLFFLIHAIALAVLDKVTAFAPDEVSYIQVFENLYTQDFDLDPFLGWPSESVNVLRLLYLPAKVLQIAGFSSFYSVRILSILCAFIALYALLRSAPPLRLLGVKTTTWISGVFFVPSVFLWTTLGLRESFLFLSLTVIFLIIRDSLNLNVYVRTTLLILATIVLFITKLYLYCLLLVAFVVAICVVWIIKRRLDKLHVFFIAIYLAPLLIFPTITNAAVVSANKAVVAQFNPTPTTTPTTTPTEGGSELIRTRGETLHSLEEQLDRNPLINWMARVSGLDGYLDAKVNGAILDASLPQVADNLKSLKSDPANLSSPLSLISGIATFLFVPTPFVDNGSLFQNILSYESFFWYLSYALFVTLIFNIVKRKIRPTFSVLTASIFTVEFLVISALVETNHGTLIRHRAVFLIGVLAILALSERKHHSAS